MGPALRALFRERWRDAVAELVTRRDDYRRWRGLEADRGRAQDAAAAREG